MKWFGLKKFDEYSVGYFVYLYILLKEMIDGRCEGLVGNDDGGVVLN